MLQLQLNILGKQFDWGGGDSINIFENLMKTVIPLTRKMHFLISTENFTFNFKEFRKPFQGLMPRNPLVG